MSKLFYIANDKVSVVLSGAYEKKIKTSAWSINQELKLDYAYKYLREYIPYSFQTSEVNGMAIRYVVEPRYYYNLKKRMLNGKSANNLSGNYIAIHSANTLSHTFLNLPKEYTNSIFVTALGAVWGMQRRLFGNGFVDAKVGVVRKLNENFHDFIIEGVEPVLDLKIGFAF